MHVNFSLYSILAQYTTPVRLSIIFMTRPIANSRQVKLICNFSLLWNCAQCISNVVNTSGKVLNGNPEHNIIKDKQGVNSCE